MPRTPEALSWSPHSTEQIPRLIQDPSPVVDLLLPQYSLCLLCAFSLFLTPGIPISSSPKKSLPSTLLPSSNFTIFNLPFTAKPLQRVISMHTHRFLYSHSLPVPFAISTPPPHTGLTLTSQTPVISQPHTLQPPSNIKPYDHLLSSKHHPLLVLFQLFASICSSALGLPPLGLWKLFIYYLVYGDSSSHSSFQISPKSIFPTLASLQGSRLPSVFNESTHPLAIH